MNVVATVVFVALFVGIAVLGFASAHWRKGDMNHLHEWGLGGRRFGTWITWFLIGGDLYTAYTFVAVPALVFGAGALGFFALPYTVLVYPMVFAILPRLWIVAKKHNYITASDFVAGRYGSPALALAIAVTGIVATMPYIALQLVGIQVVIGGLGFSTQGLMGDVPLVIAFVILAAFTYTSGLRAPASIAVVKDLLVYITVIALIIVVPYKLGGFGNIFAAIPKGHLLLPPVKDGNLGLQTFYPTLAFGSALALMLYPHATTAVLSAKGPNTLRRNWVFLPAYSFMLGLIALLGYMAYASGIAKLPDLAPYFKQYGPQFAMPGLLLHYFPSWFVGVGFAAVAIGALVPAAIMSIAAANLFTRNIYKPYINPNCSTRKETEMAKLVSLLVKFGALLFIVFLPLTYAIQLQLLGGILILQTLPAIVSGIYTRWFDAKALLLGWAAGLVWGVWAASLNGFKTSGYALHIAGMVIPAYIGLYALVINFVVAIVATLVIGALGMANKQDATVAADYAG
ncbi:monocarboxylate uptake permease MctP [Thiomonas arsenitoxydans]|jgi:SSS family solute:Na+ symporter|uniref:monocarboxylate uptake permease MctP n=1 Tax=Thiomonas arsenitoxydans (strain DSM 22701 / CIP 110005 / 3As) TaxID=426114 RepID=UPI001AC3F7DE|nr:sodium:solute symporter [Thiomonas arsenitoxydans]MBN8775872.1 sodium:solute symporter [Thiomonas arsenitoxydans]